MLQIRDLNHDAHTTAKPEMALSDSSTIRTAFEGIMITLRDSWSQRQAISMNHPSQWTRTSRFVVLGAGFGRNPGREQQPKHLGVELLRRQTDDSMPLLSRFGERK